MVGLDLLALERPQSTANLAALFTYPLAPAQLLKVPGHRRGQALVKAVAKLPF
jgi:hypothetical protein